MIACGVWSPRLARMAGASIPLTPAVHQMIDIGPVPRFADAKSAIEYPIVRDMDTNMYERQDGSGLEVGSYAHRPILHDPDEIPSIEEAALSPTEFPFTEDDFVQQMEHALELMPEIVGDESVGIKYAINGLLSLTPDGLPILGETPEVQRALVGRRGLGQGGPRRRPGAGRVDGRGRARDRPAGLRRGALPRAPEERRARAGARRPRASTRPTGSSTRASSGSPTATCACRRSTSASASSARSSTRPPAGSARTGTSRTRGLVEEFDVAGREAEWDSRWWSPIINAEHLAMRDRAGDVRPDRVLRLRRRRPGRARVRAARVDAPDGREASARSSTRRCSRRAAASAPT